MSNPLLFKIKLPGKVFQLPSKGIFYKEGILAESVINGEIQVSAMSALSEMKLRSADLLISGKVLEEVCRDCIPEILKPGLLISKDVDAIFCFLVIATYGNNKTINTIHNCKNAEYHDYEVDLSKIIEKPNNSILDHKDIFFKKELSFGQTLNIKQITFEDGIKSLSQHQDFLNKNKDVENIDRLKLEEVIISDVLNFIESIETPDPEAQEKTLIITDKKLIYDWLKNLTKNQLTEIIDFGNSSGEWGFNFNVDLICKDCSEQVKYNLELNPINFFNG